MPKAAESLPVGPRSRWPGVLRVLAPRSRRGFAGAALVAMMIGIVVNAVALQHGRRVDLAPAPAPLEAHAAAPAIRPAPAPVVRSAPVAAPEPARPSPTALARAEKADDPIAGLLRAQSADKRKLTASAQAALARLGYPLKASGVMDGETKSALAAFEKSHKLPVTNEITPRLVKSLSAAADE